MIAHFDRGWAETHREPILLFARDFANPSSDDVYFPAWRNKDWFMGFSWASGIALAAGQPFRNGRNQESTSESVRARVFPFKPAARARAARARRSARARAPRREERRGHDARVALRSCAAGPTARRDVTRACA